MKCKYLKEKNSPSSPQKINQVKSQFKKIKVHNSDYEKIIHILQKIYLWCSMAAFGILNCIRTHTYADIYNFKLNLKRNTFKYDLEQGKTDKIFKSK